MTFGPRTRAIAWLVLLLAASARADYALDQPMRVARLGGVDIAYTTAGSPDDPAVLLIAGMAASHRLWGEEFVRRLGAAGYYVVLFDNRDTGDSSFLDELGTPVLWWVLLKGALGCSVDAPYTLHDMAADGIGVLDALGIERAHVVGASLGGMIAQIVAAEHPERTRSLVSIMSTTGARHLPPPGGEAPEGFDELAPSELHALGFHPEALPRQLVAIVHAGDRSASVASISVPTLVQHGADDTTFPPAHGEHTAELIEGARLVIYPGMGHDVPPEVLPALLADMVAHFRASD